MAGLSDGQKKRGSVHSKKSNRAHRLLRRNKLSIEQTLEKKNVERRPLNSTAGTELLKLVQHIHFQLGEFIMSEAQVELVEPQTFTINIPSVGAPVTVGTKSDEIVILVRLTLRPRDNVMNIDLDVSASGDSTPMAGFDKNAPFDFSRYCGAVVAL